MQNSHDSSIHRRYLFALACMDLGKFDEGERALLPQATASKLLSQKITADDVHSVPGGAAGLYLLGKFSRKQHRAETAIDYFKLSLEVLFLILRCIACSSYR